MVCLFSVDKLVCYSRYFTTITNCICRLLYCSFLWLKPISICCCLFIYIFIYFLSSRSFNMRWCMIAWMTVGSCPLLFHCLDCRWCITASMPVDAWPLSRAFICNPPKLPLAVLFETKVACCLKSKITVFFSTSLTVIFEHLSFTDGK